MSGGRRRLLQLLVLSLALTAASGCGGGGSDPAAEPSPVGSASPAPPSATGPTPTPEPPATSDPPPTTPGQSTPGSPGTPGAATQLTIVVDDGSGRTTRWTLSCEPVGGDHPDPAAACRVLEQHGRTALPAVAKGLMCAQVYGGPETATVTGTWRGQPVTSRFARTDSCQISRWDRLVGLLPKPAQ